MRSALASCRPPPPALLSFARAGNYTGTHQPNFPGRPLMYCLSSFFQHHGARRYGLSDARYRPRSQQGSISGKNCRFLSTSLGSFFSIPVNRSWTCVVCSVTATRAHTPQSSPHFLTDRPYTETDGIYTKHGGLCTKNNVLTSGTQPALSF